MEEGQWISDSIIALWFKYLQDEVHGENSNMIFIPPSVTQVLKEGFTDDFSIILEPLNIWQKKYIFMAVNDNKSKTEPGGQHWSLLIYTIKEDMWYHYDSLNNLNLKEARYLVGRIQDYLRPGATPKITEAICTQQDNNYDCGAYTMIYAQNIAKILEGNSHDSKGISKCIFDKNDPKNLRKEICNMISTKMSEIHINRGENNSNDSETNNQMDTSTQQNINNNNNKSATQKEVCWHWKNRKCKNKTDCKYDHPEQCKDMLESGLCKDSKCKLVHPKICRNLFFRKYCSRGDSCWFIHPSKIIINQNKQYSNQNRSNISNSIHNQNMNSNTRWNNQTQHTNPLNNQNMNNYSEWNNQNTYTPNESNKRNMNSNFLETHQPIGKVNSNWSHATSQNQPMIQMLQNIMGKMSIIENKMTHMEMERGLYNYN